MRQQIYETVQERPGVHFRELQRRLDCSSSTLNYHLPHLEVEESEIHGYRRFYPEEVSDELKVPLAALNHDVRGRMLYRISQGADSSELADELDVSKSTVSNHLKILRKDGLVEEEHQGRRKELSLSPRASEALKKYASQFIEEASEGFIEMWE